MLVSWPAFSVWIILSLAIVHWTRLVRIVSYNRLNSENPREHVRLHFTELAGDSGSYGRFFRIGLPLVWTHIRQSLARRARQDSRRNKTFAHSLHYHLFHYIDHLHRYGGHTLHAAGYFVAGRRTPGVGRRNSLHFLLHNF